MVVGPDKHHLLDMYLDFVKQWKQPAKPGREAGELCWLPALIYNPGFLMRMLQFDWLSHSYTIYQPQECSYCWLSMKGQHFFFIFLSFGETLRQKWKIIFLKANGRSSLKSLKKRPSIGQTRWHWDYLTYQYQMPVVEDLVADCASIASVHIQFWDPSHHEKPDARKTAMKCEIAYLGKTLQGLLHRTKFSLTQQHNQLYLYSLDFTISRWRIHITFKAYSVKLSWKRESKVHRIRHHCQYSICLFLDLEVTSSPEWELNDELQTRVTAVSIMPGWILWSQNCNWKLQTSTVLKWLIKYAN